MRQITAVGIGEEGQHRRNVLHLFNSNRQCTAHLNLDVEAVEVADILRAQGNLKGKGLILQTAECGQRRLRGLIGKYLFQ